MNLPRSLFSDRAGRRFRKQTVTVAISKIWWSANRPISIWSHGIEYTTGWAFLLNFKFQVHSWFSLCLNLQNGSEIVVTSHLGVPSGEQ